MKLTGTIVPESALLNMEPNMVLVVISDKNRAKKVIRVEWKSAKEGDACITGTIGEETTAGATTEPGCWVKRDGQLVWESPCTSK